MLVITGAISSSTVFFCTCPEAFPIYSLSLHDALPIYRLAQLRGTITSLWLIVTAPGQLSVATTALSLAADTSAAQLTVVLAGMLVITGAISSSTVMVCTWLEALPHTSVAV